VTFVSNDRYPSSAHESFKNFHVQQSKPARQTPIKYVRTLLRHFKACLKMLSKDSF